MPSESSAHAPPSARGSPSCAPSPPRRRLSEDLAGARPQEREDTCVPLLPGPQVQLLRKLEFLGGGKYGEASLVVWAGRPAVLKEATAHSSFQDFKREFLALRRVAGAGGAPTPLGLCESPPALLMSRAGIHTLHKVLWRHTLSDAELLEVALRLCRRVEEVHGKGVVHNDLKDNNIMVGANLEVHIVDFGLASLEHEAAERDVPACADWLAPEVRRRGGSRSFASDVYSVGHALGQIYDEMSWPSGKFLEAIRAATRRAPEERPTMRELASLLERLQGQSEAPSIETVAEWLAGPLASLQDALNRLKSKLLGDP